MKKSQINEPLPRHHTNILFRKTVRQQTTSSTPHAHYRWSSSSSSSPTNRHVRPNGRLTRVGEFSVSRKRWGGAACSSAINGYPPPFQLSFFGDEKSAKEEIDLLSKKKTEEKWRKEGMQWFFPPYSNNESLRRLAFENANLFSHKIFQKLYL